MQKAFGTLKEALTTAPVLAYSYHEKPFVVATDASIEPIREVLSELDGEGKEHPIHYASRGLSSPEKNYSTYEREASAISFALKKFRHYLLCQKFKLITDHETFKYVTNMKDLHGRIARWMSTFTEYDFGNANADCLSRPADVEDIFLHVSLGSDMDAVKKYLITGTIEAATPSIRKATKILPKNYVVYDHNLYRRSPKDLRYIPDEEK